MLTGRNHHTVAAGVIQELATGYPGYSGIIPKSCVTFAELLKQAGYTNAWFGRNEGRFDMGWDEYRRIAWENQLEHGSVPPGTQLTARPEQIPARNDHSDEQKALFARQAEVYADFLEHTDHEVGRLVDATEQMGELDDTLVIYILGDNGSTGDFSGDVWELYNIAEDFSQAVDLAEQEPEKLLHLRLRFIGDAQKYNVLPLDDRMAERFDVTLRPSFFAGRDTVTLYPGMIRLPEGSAPKTVSIEHTITARSSVPEGVIVCLGGEAAGWSLMLWVGKARYHYNFFGLERYDAMSDQPLAAGDHELRVEFRPDSPAPAVPATVTLFVDGERVDEVRIARQIPNRCGTESLDVGMDCVSAVSDDYAERRGEKGLFPFTGEIGSVNLHLGEGPEVTGMDLLRLSVKMD